MKVPTIRNADKRASFRDVKSYMHNGAFKTLEQVVHFYNTRDVLPRCRGLVLPSDPRFGRDCWPAPEVTANVLQDEIGNLKLTPQEEAAIVAFLKTLSDR
jgi:cytochrome c peroxidase